MSEEEPKFLDMRIAAQVLLMHAKELNGKTDDNKSELREAALSECEEMLKDFKDPVMVDMSVITDIFNQAYNYKDPKIKSQADIHEMILNLRKNHKEWKDKKSDE